MINLLRPKLWRRARRAVCFSVERPSGSAASRKSFPIWIEAPTYNVLSGGVRAMTLLCVHLNRLGYDAFIVDRPDQNVAPLPLRYLTPSIVKEQERERREPIVVYAEATSGNPLRARFVVRYLLNKPGFLTRGAERSFGKDDYFIDGAREHAPAGVRSFDLFMPLVDRAVYFPSSSAQRTGFTVFSNRVAVDPASLPDWVTPHTILSMKRPRSHAELGELYRRSRAMVTFERTSAIFEGLSCGCPVICIENDRDNFKEQIWQPRFRDAGVIWGWHEAQLEAATAKTAQFRTIYAELESSLDHRIQTAFDWILEDVWRRAHGQPRMQS